jgi:hypothetical protein
LTAPSARPPARERRLWITLGVAVFYAMVGVATSALNGADASTTSVRITRFAAWGVSLVVFLAQVIVERTRLRVHPRSVAADAALATAIGALVLAVRAALHAVSAGRFEERWALALVLWPLLLAMPAFVIAFGLSSMLRPRGEA